DEAPDRFYRWIILDAFNSDVIPVHLLTREAIQVYLSKLAPHGFLVFHISNHTLEFEPVLASLAKDAGLSALMQHDETDAAMRAAGKFASDWVVAAQDPVDLTSLRRDSRWRELRGSSGRVWSDDYSNVL